MVNNGTLQPIVPDSAALIKRYYKHFSQTLFPKTTLPKIHFRNMEQTYPAIHCLEPTHITIPDKDPLVLARPNTLYVDLGLVFEGNEFLPKNKQYRDRILRIWLTSLQLVRLTYLACKQKEGFELVYMEDMYARLASGNHEIYSLALRAIELRYYHLGASFLMNKYIDSVLVAAWAINPILRGEFTDLSQVAEVVRRLTLSGRWTPGH